MRIFIGIDPGQTGAMAMIAPKGIKVWDYDDGEGISWLKELSVQIKNSLLTRDPIYSHAVLEKVHSMPKQGVSSSFKFGDNFGQWKGRLDALGIPYDLVTPQKWQKEIFDSMTKTDRKTMSLDRARRLFPEMSDMLKRKKDHNRAEALLIAEYCRRMDK